MKCEKCHAVIDEKNVVSQSTLKDVAASVRQDVSDSFVMLPRREEAAQKTTFVPRMLRAQKLDALLRTEDAVLEVQCRDCNDKLLDMMARELENLQRECARLGAFEKDYERRKGSVSLTALAKDIAKLKKAETAARERLVQLDGQVQGLEHEKAALDAEEAELAAKETRIVSEYTHQVALREKAEEAQLKALQQDCIEGLETLTWLHNTNVYNDAFSIGQDGFLGTINGLRFGRLPNTPVDWPEINAAWGEVALLLYTVTRKLDIIVDGYELVPMGSVSRIVKTAPDPATYELYGSGDFALGRILHNRRFDMGMVAFLAYLDAVMEHMEASDASIEFPHAVSRDKIGDVSIKLQFSTDESWSRALRFLLVDLKYLLARM